MCWRRENMVGVSMALAQFIRFNHGLCNSCGIECFEGIVLEPYIYIYREREREI